MSRSYIKQLPAKAKAAKARYPKSSLVSVDPALASQVDALMGDASVQAATVGTYVGVAGVGKAVYARNALTPLRPASNLKLVTTSAALSILGPDYTFRTDVVEGTTPDASGVLASDLYLRGTADPTLLDADLQALAAQVRAAGITRVAGNLVADTTFFDDVRYQPTWKPEWLSEYYAPQVSGLTLSPTAEYDIGNIVVNYAPGAAGAKATLSVTPASASGYVTLVNNTVTGTAGTSDTVSLTRTPGTNTITVSGRVPAGQAQAQHFIPVDHPALYALYAFQRDLAAAGVTVSGIRALGPTPATGTVVAKKVSAPLSSILTPYLKLSNNGIAETLVKTLGRSGGQPGTWDAGTAVVSSWLTSNYLSTPGVTVRDGSGLSYDNRMTAQTIIRVLHWDRVQPWFDTFYAALPIAGNPDKLIGGTLRNRMIGTVAANNLHGKTGTLSGVTALSGYVRGADGRLYVFSMLSTYTGASPRIVEDKLGILLASWRTT